MKILHTADWHLGKRLENFNRHAEQVTVLREICDIADKEAVDVILIAGDLYDTFNPPIESTELFYTMCKRLTHNGLRPVIAIAGNHDSPERIEAPDPLARACGIVFSGFPHTIITPFELETGVAVTRSDEGFIELKLPQYDYALRLFLTPYANEYRLKLDLRDKPEENLRQMLTEHWSKLSEKYADTEGVNICVAHLYVMEKDGIAPDEPDEERPIYVGGAGAIHTECFPATFQYVALGHLHRQQVISGVPCPIVYCGSPLAYSFAEENQDKYVMLIDATPAKTVVYKRIKLMTPRLLLKGRFDNMESALAWLATVPNALIQLTMVSDTYLKVVDIRELEEAHAGIVKPIIPEIGINGVDTEGSKIIDLTANIRDLFADYFKSKNKGQAANEEILHLFDEMLSSEDDG